MSLTDTTESMALTDRVNFVVKSDQSPSDSQSIQVPSTHIRPPLVNKWVYRLLSLSALLVFLPFLFAFFYGRCYLGQKLTTQRTTCNTNFSGNCFQVCQSYIPEFVARLRYSYKAWDGKKVKTFTLFTYPEEEELKETMKTGKPLNVSLYIESGQLEEAVKQSRVHNIFNSASPNDDDVVSFSGFISVNSDSHLFFWFIVAKYNPVSSPLILWLQGGPGASSLYGLLKENGPYLVMARKMPSTEPYLIANPHSWNNVANVLYIDNPVGSGFSYTTNETMLGGYHKDEAGVAADLIVVLNQFLLLYPHYVNTKNDTDPPSKVKPNLFLFGESYGGSYVIHLAKAILDKGLTGASLSGIGMGNAWFSPVHQSNSAEFIHNLGLIKDSDAENMKKINFNIQKLLSKGHTKDASNMWQEGMSNIMKLIDYTNPYDIRQSQIDVAAQNYWHFVQQPRIRRALHIGNRHFSDGIIVYAHLLESLMIDKSPILSEVLNRKVPVLVYHGIMDIILPVSGMVRALDALTWNGRSLFGNKSKQSYWYRDDTTGYSQIIGYVQQGGGLTFLVIRNSGHMVPIDQPLWTLRFLQDFLVNGNLSES